MDYKHTHYTHTHTFLSHFCALNYFFYVVNMHVSFSSLKSCTQHSCHSNLIKMVKVFSSCQFLGRYFLVNPPYRFSTRRSRLIHRVRESFFLLSLPAMSIFSFSHHKSSMSGLVCRNTIEIFIYRKKNHALTLSSVKEPHETPSKHKPDVFSYFSTSFQH